MFRTLLIFLTLHSFALSQDIIIDVPSQSFEFAAGDAPTPFNVKVSAKKKPAPVVTVKGSIFNGSTLSNTIAWTATTSGNGPIEFLVDGTVKWTELTAPWEFGGVPVGFDTKQFSNGTHTLVVRAGTVVHSVSVTIWNTVFPTPTPTPIPSGAINLGAYANGTDLIDDTVQIRNAINAAKAQAKGVYAPAGKYRFSQTLNFENVPLIGDGSTSEFVATNYKSGAMMFMGNSPKCQNIKRSCNVSGLVWTAPSDHNHCGIVVMNATNALVSNVVVDGTGKVGILNIQSTGTKILNCFVARSLKDGIHNEYGSTNYEIGFNEVTDTGDDMISIVSYDRAGDLMQRGGYIHDNYVHDNYFARGISVVGGEDVRIINNRITNSRVSGLYIWSEDSHQTRGVKNVIIEGNVLTGCNTDTSSNWPAISVGGRSLYLCQDVIFRNNKVIDSRRDAIGIKPYVKNIQFYGTTITGTRTSVGFKDWNIDPSVASQVFITP